MSIFEPRENIKPYEYPFLLDFVNAIDDSFWTVRKFDFQRDVMDFNYNLSDAERSFCERGMLAISQVENTVKSFFGRLDVRLPKPEISFVGSKFSANECFDEETEVLTENGFVKFKNLPKDVKVAQYDMNTKEITFEHPIGYIEKKYQGIMHHYQSKSCDLKVTPNHDILVINPHSRKLRKAKSYEGKWGRNFLFPASGYQNMNNNKGLTFEHRLLIALQADGSIFGETPSGKGRRDFVFTLAKERKIKRLKWILSNCNIEYNERTRIDWRGNEKTVISALLPEWVSSKDVKTFGWIELYKVNENWCNEFIEELVKWDGADGRAFYNTNEKAVDKVQALCVLSGFIANKGINRTAEQSMRCKNPNGTIRKSAKDCYVLYITKQDFNTYPHRKEVFYDGNVYCVTMPKGTVVIRRGKRVSIQGNCTHSLAYSECLEKLGLNDDFKELLEVPAMKGRVAYLKKYLSGLHSRSDKEFTKSLILFTLLIENISLYAPFYLMTAIKKNTGKMKTVGKVVSATIREEQLHSLFGATIIKIIRQENPEWFDDEMEQKIRRNIRKAVKCEIEVINWMFENGETDYLKKEYVVEFLKYRANNSLELIDYAPEYELNEELLQHSKYIDVMQKSQSDFDFFDDLSTDYNKSVSFDTDSEDLFNDL